MTESFQVIPGRERHLPVMLIRPELFGLYQPVIGAGAVLLWLNLKYAADFARNPAKPRSLAEVREELGFSSDEMERELQILEQWGLVERRPPGQDGPGALLIHDPLPEAEFLALATRNWRFRRNAEFSAPLASGADVPVAEGPTTKAPQPQEIGSAAAPTAPSGGPAESSDGSQAGPRVSDDEIVEELEPLERVIAAYHDRIGLLSEMHFEKLRYWLEDQHMDPAVMIEAIEETARSAISPRLSYLEAVLRQWHQDGVRTVEDLSRYREAWERLKQGRREAAGAGAGLRKGASGAPGARGLAKNGRRPGDERRPASGSGYEGMPNAGAYRKVDNELIKRWREMYPDEYKD